MHLLHKIQLFFNIVYWRTRHWKPQWQAKRNENARQWRKRVSTMVIVFFFLATPCVQNGHIESILVVCEVVSPVGRSSGWPWRSSKRCDTSRIYSASNCLAEVGDRMVIIIATYDNRHVILSLVSARCGFQKSHFFIFLESVVLLTRYDTTLCMRIHLLDFILFI